VVLANVASLLASFRYYRRFYVRMKNHHWSEWSALMERDEVVANLGEWYRWPFGSFHLIQSYLRRSVDFGDSDLRALKEKGRIASYVFVSSFLIFLVVMIVLPGL
jgi:hypothetical protein